jgi:hypothetical protein
MPFFSFFFSVLCWEGGSRQRQTLTPPLSPHPFAPTDVPVQPQSLKTSWASQNANGGEGNKKLLSGSPNPVRQSGGREGSGTSDPRRGCDPFPARLAHLRALRPDRPPRQSPGQEFTGPSSPTFPDSLGSMAPLSRPVLTPPLPPGRPLPPRPGPKMLPPRPTWGPGLPDGERALAGGERG